VTCCSENGHLPLSRSAPPVCLLWVVRAVCVKGFKAFKCTSLNASMPFGFLTPLRPFESSSLRLFFFIPVKPCIAFRGRTELSPCLSNSLSLEPRRLHCKTFWLQTSSSKFCRRANEPVAWEGVQEPLTRSTRRVAVLNSPRLQFCLNCC